MGQGRRRRDRDGSSFRATAADRASRVRRAYGGWRDAHRPGTPDGEEHGSPASAGRIRGCRHCHASANGARGTAFGRDSYGPGQPGHAGAGKRAFHAGSRGNRHRKRRLRRDHRRVAGGSAGRRERAVPAGCGGLPERFRAAHAEQPLSMIRRIIEWSLANRLLVLLATLLRTAWGVYSAHNIALDAIPDLSDTQVIVKTAYPGQSPQLVEDSVTYPLTSSLLSVPGATAVRGFSMFGESYVYVIFKDGVDPYWARSRVLEYLSQAASRLPVGVTPTLGPDASGTGWIFEYALVDRHHRYDADQLRAVQDFYLKYELQGLPGVAEVASVGGMVRQFQIEVDPNRLAAYRISLEQGCQAVRDSNLSGGWSVMEMARAEYMIRANGYLKSLDDFRTIPLGTDAEGVPIRLQDVAHVQTGPEARRGVADLDGEGDVTGGIVVMRYGNNALETAARVTARLKDLPAGILAAFIVRKQQGGSANIMSLGGIAIAIGALVDAAIVMIENMHKHLERAGPGSDYWAVARASSVEVGPALFFSLLIITVSFLPVFALSGQEGKLFAPLAYTKTYAMAASAALAVTLTPVLMGYFIRGRIVHERSNPLNRVLQALYRPALLASLNHPKRVLLLAVLLLASAAWPVSRLGSEFMPPLYEGDLLYMPTTQPGVSVDEAANILQITDRLIRQMPDVARVFGKAGRADSATDPAPLSMLETTILLKPRNEWPPGETVEELIQKLARAVRLPGLTNSWGYPIRTRIDMLSTGIRAAVGLKLTGPDLAVIAALAKTLEATLKKIPGTRAVFGERGTGGRYLDIDIDRAQAARYGVTVATVQRLVQSAIGGENIGTVVDGREPFYINQNFLCVLCVFL